MMYVTFVPETATIMVTHIQEALGVHEQVNIISLFHTSHAGSTYNARLRSSECKVAESSFAPKESLTYIRDSTKALCRGSHTYSDPSL